MDGCYAPSTWVTTAAIATVQTAPELSPRENAKMIVDLEVAAKVEHDEVTAEATSVSVVAESERGSPAGNAKGDAALLEENVGAAPYRGVTVKRRVEAALAARVISRGAAAASTSRRGSDGSPGNYRGGG